jgi:hypothetical protein
VTVLPLKSLAGALTFRLPLSLLVEPFTTMRIPGHSRCFFALLAMGFAIAVNVMSAVAAETNTIVAPKSAGDAEAAYTKVIEDRVTKIVAPLKLEDQSKSAKVHSLLVAQYRSLRDWHDANDASRKKAAGDELAKINDSLKALHEKFIAGLAAELTPEQVESVKDAMTYGKVQFTFKGYLAEYPELTGEQQQKVLELLKEARELAGGSSDEKTAIFNRYKGKINNWLSAQGVTGNKKKAASASTNAPANKP